MKHICMVGALVMGGCGPVLDHFRDQKPVPKPEANAKAELIEGGIQIVADGSVQVLRWRYSTQNVFTGKWTSNDVQITLDGPGVHYRQEAERPWYGQTVWDKAWPPGAYRLTMTQFGVELAHRAFTVRKPPSPEKDGDTFIVDSPKELPVIMYRNEWETTIAHDVTRPVISVESVWMKAGAPLDTPRMDIERMSELSTGGPLGVYDPVSGNLSGFPDLHGATLYIFENAGARLVGAWSYADASEHAVVLPRTKADAKELATARASVIEAEKAELAWIPDLGISVDEPTVCAVMASASARDTYYRLARASREEAFEVNRQLEAQDEQEDPDLTREQRAKAKQKQKDASDSTMAYGEARIRNAGQFKALVKKFKPGCMAALEVPATSSTRLP